MRKSQVVLASATCCLLTKSGPAPKWFAELTTKDVVDWSEFATPSLPFNHVGSLQNRLITQSKREIEVEVECG